MPIVAFVLLLIVVAPIAILVLVFAASRRPDTFRVERTMLLAAPPAVVFERVDDFHHWDAWSPWAKIDPNMAVTYEGAPAGPGAVYLWKGNKKAGEGRMEILESRRNEFVRIALEFFKPFPASNTAEFTFVPEEGGTRVTWAMYGTNSFLAKAFGLLMRFDMDRLVGGDFERGLTALNEATSPKPIA